MSKQLNNKEILFFLFLAIFTPLLFIYGLNYDKEPYQTLDQHFGVQDIDYEGACSDSGSSWKRFGFQGQSDYFVECYDGNKYVNKNGKWE